MSHTELALCDQQYVTIISGLVRILSDLPYIWNTLRSCRAVALLPRRLDDIERTGMDEALNLS